MRRGVACVIVASACGAPAPSVELPAAPRASAAPVSPKPPPACELRLRACRRVVEPVRVSGALVGQSPEVVWDGRAALVAFDTPGQGTRLSAVSVDGSIAWTERLPGSYPHLAWNPRTHGGLVVTSETIAWLGADGKPVHQTSAPRVTNVAFQGAPIATDRGFLVATGVVSIASRATPMPFSVAILDAPTDAIAWRRVADDGLRIAAQGGPADEASWLVSQARGSAPQLFSVSPTGDLGAPTLLPEAAAMRAVAVTDHRDEAWVVLDEPTHDLAWVAVRGGAPSAPEKLGARAQRSGSAVFLRLGDRTFLGADKIGDSPGVALAPFEAAPPHLGAPLAIGPEASQSLRVAATDEGFVAVWNIADDGAPLQRLVNHAPMHALSTMLAIYACCPR